MFLEIVFLTNSFSLSVNSGAGSSGGIRFSTNLTKKTKKVIESKIPIIDEKDMNTSVTDI